MMKHAPSFLQPKSKKVALVGRRCSKSSENCHVYTECRTDGQLFYVQQTRRCHESLLM